MNRGQLIRRMGRRETHSARSVLSITVAAVLVAITLWLGLELVLSATGNNALLVSPPELARRAASLGTATLPPALTAAGAALALLGLLLLAAAFLPGRKARHIIENPRSAVVVDRDVLASALARTARTTARLAPEQVSASVGRRNVQVRVHPGSGRPVDQAAVREAVDRDVSGYSLAGKLRVAVVVSPQGVVGA